MRLLSQEATQPALASSPLFNRRDLIRAALFASASAALGPAFSFGQAVDSGLTAAARGEDGAAFLKDPNWKLAFLNDQQNETLIALGEVIIPATDSPGAKDALVNRYLDLLVSAQPTEFQQQFVDALSFKDSASQDQFAKDFRALSLEDQISLLTPWAYARKPSHWGGEHPDKAEPAQEHFERLKALIAAAYYGSEIGQKELGWGESSDHDLYNDCGTSATPAKPIHITPHKLTHK